jgi:NADPH2:quinone reductase
VNPLDFKLRQGDGQQTPYPEVVPHQDGAGTIDAVGAEVDSLRVGQRVWLWEASFRRPSGTAQEYTVLPARHAVPLPGNISFETGASIGIPAVTAHRALTIHEDAPRRLEPGALAGFSVLVAGGTGAVGHAAIQLARWAGADVAATVRSAEKAALATAAGASLVLNHQGTATADKIRQFAPDGVDMIVEVAPARNAELNAAVAGTGTAIAVYADTGGGTLCLPVGTHMFRNIRYQFVLAYEMRDRAKADALAAVQTALEDGTLSVGEMAGLPLIRFSLADTALAHDALQRGVTGKVLVDVTL